MARLYAMFFPINLEYNIHLTNKFSIKGSIPESSVYLYSIQQSYF